MSSSEAHEPETRTPVNEAVVRRGEDHVHRGGIGRTGTSVVVVLEDDDGGAQHERCRRARGSLRAH
ncbi:hypothetical protein [Quadrisphaera setariae]|uniref:Uncharacterized protein n=1 Tax=Quadrisphaera setariae TaxID=2593304 RepID=A0A5C8ZBG0_9ACTN|nr:hypothetical protein [Quadrisphaera setariae]TXR55435.1 hypothetical protein FMM08_14025 [Quadrisphaera setariae]